MQIITLEYDVSLLIEKTVLEVCIRKMSYDYMNAIKEPLFVHSGEIINRTSSAMMECVHEIAETLYES